MQIERLGNESLKGEALKTEIERSKAVTLVAKEIICNGRLVLDAKLRVADIPEKTALPAMLE